MKLTENTKVRVKVPKHLYEAIQAELDKKHEMEEGEEMNEYVGMSPDQAQVAEILGTLIASGGLAVGIKTALQMALDKIKSKKSSGEEKGDINEYVGMSPDQMQVAEILGSLIAAGGLGVAVKTALQMALDKIKSKKSGDAETKEPVAEAEEMEEALDFNTLMEAVKDASKKKAEEKKKKEAEAKKKKVEDEKKKKEAEAKKKAATKKKAVNEIFGFGKSKNQFKPEQKVIYTASNGSTEYNGEYVVGKVYDNGQIGLYKADSPMKKITINAKPENLKAA